jgi:hypothetical protein
VRSCGKVLPLVRLETRVFDPEVGVPTLAPIGHPVGVEELESKVEAAHLAIFVEVPDQLALQVRVTLCRGRAGLSADGVAECFTTSIGP